MPFNMSIFFSGKETKKYTTPKLINCSCHTKIVLNFTSDFCMQEWINIKSTKNQYFELYSNSILRHKQLSCHIKIVLNYTVDIFQCLYLQINKKSSQSQIESVSSKNINTATKHWQGKGESRYWGKFGSRIIK